MGASVRCRAAWSLMFAFLSYCLLAFSSSAQIRFERTYGGDTLDYGGSVQQAGDGGYIIAGYTYSFGAGRTDVYLVKTDSVGDTTWTRTYGGGFHDRGYSVEQTDDGGYVIAGYTSTFGPDVYLVKTDSVGDTMWTRTCGRGDSEGYYGFSVEQTDDGGYIVAGYAYSFAEDESDIYLVKTDSVGDTVWTRTYGGIDWDLAYSVQQTHDRGYIVGGHTRSFGAGSVDFYLVKTDSVGDTIWTRTYGGVESDGVYSVRETRDGGYIVAGHTGSFGAGAYDVYLVKTDSVGDSVWSRTYGGSVDDAAYCVEQTEDGGYILAGRTHSFSAGLGDIYLVKTDSVGNSIWASTYGGVENDFANAVRQTDDGGYVVVGGASSFGAGSYDVYLVKTGPNGQVWVLGDRSRVGGQHAHLAQNTPNPFCRSTIVSYSVPAGTEVTLSIYDITGRLVETLVDETQQPGLYKVQWDRKDNPSGVYFHRLKAGEFVETRKMVVVE